MTEIELVDRFNDDAMKAFAIFAAGILLNLGLFFVLALFAPMVVGIVCGYILGKKRNGILTGFLGAVVSYALMFIVTGFAVDIAVFGTAVLIMSLIGGAGGFIGAVLQKRMIESSS
ncbi:MAG: hypothetical protein E4H14_05380 [Candidatus Thorarchaeota archaeon]|nr:MAG: hypothetical protein E4H14_05380 [Candidatus Thorarchaeota archaeon]